MQHQLVGESMFALPRRFTFRSLSNAVLTGIACCLLAGCTGSQIKAAEESYSQGKLESTEAHLKSAVREAPDDAALALATADLGELRVAQERYVEAKDMYARALSLAEQAHDSGTAIMTGDLQVAILLRIGNLALELGNYEEAVGYYKQLEAKSADDSNRVLAWRHLARIYTLRAKFPEAEDALNRADNLVGNAGAMNSFENTLVLAERADLKATERRLSEARDLYQKVIPLLGTFKEEVNGGKTFVHLEEAEVLSDFGRLLILENQYEEADGPLQRALALRQSVVESRSVTLCPMLAVGRSFDDLAALRTATGKHEEAAMLLARALAIRQKLGSEHPLFKETEARYAEALLQAGSKG